MVVVKSKLFNTVKDSATVVLVKAVNMATCFSRTVDVKSRSFLDFIYYIR